jgi:fructose/tagatose bisphosphate aldolase
MTVLKNREPFSLRRTSENQAIKKSYAETPDIYDPKNAAGEARKAVKELIKKKISLFGSEGKAK